MRADAAASPLSPCLRCTGERERESKGAAARIPSLFVCLLSHVIAVIGPAGAVRASLSEAGGRVRQHVTRFHLIFVLLLFRFVSFHECLFFCVSFHFACFVSSLSHHWSRTKNEEGVRRRGESMMQCAGCSSRSSSSSLTTDTQQMCCCCKRRQLI